MEYSMSRQSFPIFPIFICLLVIALLGVSAMIGMDVSTPTIATQEIIVTQWAELTSAQIEIINKHGNHAYVRHGVEASLALKCLQEFGTFKSFDTFPDIDPSLNSTTHICFNPKTNSYFAVVLKKMADGSWELITAYKVLKEFFPTINNYIGYLVESWNATSSTVSFAANTIIYNFAIK